MQGIRIDAEGQHYGWLRQAKGTSKLRPHGNCRFLSARFSLPVAGETRAGARRHSASLSRSWRLLATRKINGFPSDTKVNRIPHFLKENVSYVSEVLTIHAPGILIIDNDKNTTMLNATRHVNGLLSSFVLCGVIFLVILIFSNVTFFIIIFH